MKQRILEYMNYIDKVIDDEKDEDWEELCRIHLIKIQFFQHERLVHLLVMMLVALLMMATLAVAIISEYIYMLMVTGALLVLLVPYIMHYYFLENSVQRMYDQFDALYSKVTIHSHSPLYS